MITSPRSESPTRQRISPTPTPRARPGEPEDQVTTATRKSALCVPLWSTDPEALMPVPPAAEAHQLAAARSRKIRRMSNPEPTALYDDGSVRLDRRGIRLARYYFPLGQASGQAVGSSFGLAFPRPASLVRKLVRRGWTAPEGDQRVHGSRQHQHDDGHLRILV